MNYPIKIIFTIFSFILFSCEDDVEKKPEMTLEIQGGYNFNSKFIGDINQFSTFIENSGNDTLEIKNITTPEGFDVSWTKAIIEPKEKKQISIIFKPVELKIYSGIIEILNNVEINNTQTISVSGEGIKFEFNLDYGGEWNEVPEAIEFVPVRVDQKKPENSWQIMVGTEKKIYGSGLNVKYEISNPQNINYIWDLGDGNTAFGNIVNHKYEIARDYEVKVVGKYNEMNQDSISKAWEVYYETHAKIEWHLFDGLYVGVDSKITNLSKKYNLTYYEFWIKVYNKDYTTSPHKIEMSGLSIPPNKSFNTAGGTYNPRIPLLRSLNEVDYAEINQQITPMVFFSPTSSTSNKYQLKEKISLR
jgi:hypothetical protein